MLCAVCVQTSRLGDILTGRTSLPRAALYILIVLFEDRRRHGDSRSRRDLLLQKGVVGSPAPLVRDAPVFTAAWVERLLAERDREVRAVDALQPSGGDAAVL